MGLGLDDNLSSVVFQKLIQMRIQSPRLHFINFLPLNCIYIFFLLHFRISFGPTTIVSVSIILHEFIYLLAHVVWVL